MIKKLRIKFICVIMSIVVVLLGAILGVVIHFTGENMEMQSISMMRNVANGPFKQDPPGRPPKGEVHLPFFAVRFDDRGGMTTSNNGYFDLSDEEFLREIVDAAQLSDRETGELDTYNLRYLKRATPKGLTIVFSDTTAERTTLKQLFHSCLAVFFVAIVVFLGISILLSRWVIKPVADAWNQQRQFVADASHELKTPLTVIMTNAELMQSEDAGEDSKKHAGNILGMTYQMRALVENMLEMARVDTGVVKVQFAPLDFSQLVEDAVLSFQLLYEEQGLELHSRILEGICLTGSEQQLYQVMDVLLDNALKYSSPAGTVSVELTSAGRNCVLAVASPGEAISKKDQKNIFKRFYRIDKARTVNGSYGLGLSIAESIVELHKGRIWAQSKDGQNTFFVQLPANN